MDTIALGTSGRVTTRLGFGCSHLMGATGRRDSLRLLGAAYEAGVRHFDTAPMYGFGEAEGCLGEFLAGHQDCTVTTKFGIEPARSGLPVRLARAVVGPLVQRFPGLKRRLQRPAEPAATYIQRGPNPIFQPEAARGSLERSLRALRVDRVDVWLLHEVRAADLAGNDGMLRVLEDAVASGKVGTFGVGSDRVDIQPLLAGFRAYCPVVQCEWSVLDPVDPAGGPFRIHHRALSARFADLQERLRGDAGLCARWSKATGVDLARDGVLSRLMLRASLELNPGSVVLFSSRREGHIRGNVAVAADEGLAGPARRLYQVMQAELPV